MNLLDRWLMYLKAVFGNATSQYEVGMALKNTQIPNAVPSSLIWLERAALQGHADACLRLANYHIHHKHDPDTAIRFLKHAPQEGDGFAQALLGQLLLNQYTNLIDYQRMDDQNRAGHADSQPLTELDRYIVGLAHSSNANIPKLNNKKLSNNDLYLALNQLNYAIDKNQPLAMHAKAIYILEYAAAKPEQQKEAVNQIKLAAEQGFAPSMQVLAGFYENGMFGVPVCISTGLQWRIKAAHTGSKEAQYSLGCLVYQGCGFEQEKEKGLALIQSSAQKGHKAAQDFLKQIQCCNG